MKEACMAPPFAVESPDLEDGTFFTDNQKNLDIWKRKSKPNSLTTTANYIVVGRKGGSRKGGEARKVGGLPARWGHRGGGALGGGKHARPA